MHRQTDRPTDWQADTQTDRLTDWQTDRQMHRQTDLLTGRQTHRQTDLLTGRQTDRQTDRCTDRPTYRQTDRQTEKMLICITDCVQVVQMAGMGRDVTVAVAVYMTLLAIMSLESAPAVQDGRDSGATNVSY